MTTNNAANEKTAASGKILQGQGVGTASDFSTSTYPSTNAINTILYASAANVMSALATANNGALITSGSGVPSIGTVPLAAGGTNATSFATSSGIAKYDGTRLVTSTATIDSSNIYTNASQPYTSSVCSTSPTNVTGDSTVYTPIFDATLSEQGTYYNHTTGVFTAGTTGLYLFTMSICFGNLAAAHTRGRTFLTPSAGSVLTSEFNPGVQRDDTNVATFNMQGLFKLTANDTVTPTIVVYNSTKTVTFLSAVGTYNSYLNIVKLA